jgi:hypothetical protein
LAEEWRWKYKIISSLCQREENGNTIWSLKDENGREHSSFEDLTQLGTNHFKNLFKADEQVSIDAIVQLALFFPRFVEEVDNRELMEEVTKEELKEVIHSFQKDKSPGPDGWSMDFFLGLFYFIGKDILKVVEESRINGVMHPPLNATFISLIPKKDAPQTFEDFRPISLCNNIYKVVTKIISRRLKSLLSKSISQEQFGFLEGRQIHEAIGVAQETLHSMKTKKTKGQW